MKQLETLKKEYGSVEFEGKTYILQQNAYIDSLRDQWLKYTASALCESDERDEEGCMPSYKITWYATDECQAQCLAGGYWDEGDACDWKHPDAVSRI